MKVNSKSLPKHPSQFTDQLLVQPLFVFAAIVCTHFFGCNHNQKSGLDNVAKLLAGQPVGSSEPPYFLPHWTYGEVAVSFNSQ